MRNEKCTETREYPAFAAASALRGEGVFPDLSASPFLTIPSFVDVHVHLREPGFFYKETILSGTTAAAASGYGHIFAMPNLNPVPDSVEHMNEQLSIIKRDAVIGVHPYAAITVGEKGEELSDMEGLAGPAIAFSDDGRGVQSDSMMREAMLRAKKLGKMITAHCEVNSLLKGGYIHDGEYAKAHGHRGICSESEWGQIKRDLELAKKVKESDDVVDNLFNQIRGELITFIAQKGGQDGEEIIDLLMISKYLERIGDHATNIAEWVEFSITGVHVGGK